MALAQAISAELPARDYVVVAGERTKRTLRDTASSVVVVTDRQIEDASADRVEQILDLIPNVQLSSGGEGPTIRGQDTTGASRDLYAFLGGTRPRTTLIVDGRAVTSNEFIFGIAPMWDVERVEVFRSPQTTTQGRNSIAGAIFVRTQDPAFEPEYRAREILGQLRTRQLSASASGPIVDGQVAWRVAGDYRDSRTSSRLTDRIEGADPNHVEYGLLRAKLLATPAALPGWRIELTYTHSQSQMPQVEGVTVPFRERRDLAANYGTFRANVDSLTTSLDYAPSEELAVSTVLTGGDSIVRRFAPTGLGETQIHSRDWSGETVANWSPSADVKMVGGLSHYGAKLRQYIDLSQLIGVGRFNDRQESTGLFGEASWTLAPGTTLTGGLRYQTDSQRRLGKIGSGAAAIPLDYDRTFHAWLPKLSLAYDFSDRVRAGVLVQRAYNPGGTTLRFDTGAADDFGAERLWDYELFARAELPGGKLRLSANLFYYDQRNAQRAQPIFIVAPSGNTVTFANLFNVPKARSYGGEVGVDWKASSRLSLRCGVGLLRTTIVRPGDEGTAFAGNQFQRSPKFSASAAVDWRPVERLQVSAQLHHNSGYFSDELNSAARRVGGWTKLDARAEWNAGKVRLFGYARNAFDKFYMTYLFSPSFGTAGDPRELGLGVEARF
jgi:outer membrane receptor protein involved in Fe transport